MNVLLLQGKNLNYSMSINFCHISKSTDQINLACLLIIYDNLWQWLLAAFGGNDVYMVRDEIWGSERYWQFHPQKLLLALPARN